MPIVEYTPDLFGDVSKMVSQFPGPLNLSHRPFLDYYYATRGACKLYLYYSDSGELMGTLGRELVPSQCNGKDFTLRVASNWYSLRMGIGARLSGHSAQSAPDSIGLTFTGSRDTITILRRRKWLFMPGIRGYFLNNPYSVIPGDPFWRRTAKSVLRRVRRRKISSFAARIPAQVSAEIKVREEFSYGRDLLPGKSPFRFRLAPDAEYLNWRYNLTLPFIRYRLFRINRRGANSGYVILSDSPEKIAVAHCDGEDAAALAYGVLQSILEVGGKEDDTRTVFLVCSHLEMNRIFQNFGFQQEGNADLPFAFSKQPTQVDTPFQTSDWLINFDWGDNGLRTPFYDRLVESDAATWNRASGVAAGSRT